MSILSTSNEQGLEEGVPMREESSNGMFVMPATVAQKRFWLLDQLEPGSSSLNMPLALRLKGSLDIGALEAALVHIVTRHEVLRTTFATQDRGPVQVISKQGSVKLTLEDLSGSEDPESEAERLTVDEAHEGFDLEIGPLFRTRLLKLADREHILLLTLHHIVCDGWSNGVLVRELGEIYDDLASGVAPSNEELTIQYADYAVWQEEWLKGNGFEDQLAYWKESLGSELPSLELPTDFERNNGRTSFGAIESLLLPRPLTRAIKALSQREDVTSYMIFLAAFYIMLHLRSGQEQVLIGSPTANRIHSETEALIGPFANTLLLKCDLSGNPSFAEILQRVKALSLGAFSNQTIPFEKVLESIRPSKARSSSQIFNVLFIFQTAFMKPMELKELSITPIRSVSPGSIFDVSLGVVEREEGTRLQLEYNTDLFKANTAKKMLAELEAILSSGILDPDGRMSELPARLESSVPAKGDGAPAPFAAQTNDKTLPAITPETDRTEETLIEIWKEVLQIDEIGPEDDFFQLGGHSLLAVHLFDGIRKKLGVNLPLATLFEATTVRSMVELIRKENPNDVWTSLVPINPNGSRPPLFLMHAAGGNVLFYKGLAKRLGDDQPTYGMQAVGLDGHQSAYDRIEDMAAHYLKEIQEIQPKGPYFVGGSSVGGLTAYEVALQLEEQGEEVALVALIDTYAPGYPTLARGSSKFKRKLFAKYDRAAHHVDTLRILESGQRWPYVKSKAEKAFNSYRRKYRDLKKRLKREVLERLGRELTDELKDVQSNIQIASRAYQARPYSGRVVLFRASKQRRGIVKDDTLGWSKFVTGQLDIHEVRGTHGSIVVEPRVRHVAGILREYLG
ncbi:MAG: hypothetical protein IPM63_03485 [Acidobacteriota bacterium]|nr:MAG: hypothetical protein IPM63_03485 [Acidobacteriota bacterium]